MGFRRAERERAAVERMPSETRAVRVDGVPGWLYPLTTSSGDRFELFAWFDGSAYQVRVVAPDLWGRDELLHACHLFRDARICFGAWDGGGVSSLDAAYERSVLWAHGFSAFRRGGRFTFTEGEEPCQTSP